MIHGYTFVKLTDLPLRIFLKYIYLLREKNDNFSADPSQYHRPKAILYSSLSHETLLKSSFYLPSLVATVVSRR